MRDGISNTYLVVPFPPQTLLNKNGPKFPIRLSTVSAANLVAHEQETRRCWPRPGQSKRVILPHQKLPNVGWRSGRKSLWKQQRRKKIYNFLVKRRLLMFITLVGLLLTGFSQMYQTIID